MINRLKLISAVLLSALLAASVTWVFAHGGDTGLIHSCVRNVTGSVRIVDANSSCNFLEHPVDWPASRGGGGVFIFRASLSGGPYPYCLNFFGQFDGCSEPEVSITGGYQFPVPSDGQLTKIAVYTEGNTMDVATTVTAYVNGLPSSLLATIPAGTTSTFFGSSPVDVQAGDLLVIVGHSPDGTGEIHFTGTLEYRSN
jgi:hypothetical protein